QLFDRAMGEPGVGRMRDRLLLDRNPFEIFGVDRPGAVGQREAVLQQLSMPFQFSYLCRSKVPQGVGYGDQPAVRSDLRGRPRRRGGCAGIGELMMALERTCSGIRSACWRSR